LSVWWLQRIALAAALLLVASGVWDYVQPLPAAAATLSGPPNYPVTGAAPTLPWPDVGSAAVGASGLGLIGTSGDAAPAPMASVAKVMTTLVLLADKPLAKGESGTDLIITDQDVASYTADAADHQSVVPVTAGEHLNEVQALEALLVASGNNIAETLARWDAGSVGAFVAKMNQHAAALHLTHTTFADPAGVSMQTASTPADLVALGIAAMRQDVIAQIVGLPVATLPVAGIVYNVNYALGQSGIIGIKTGFGFNLGANFLFAAAATIDGQQVTLFGCLMGQPTLDAAFKEAEVLIGTMKDTVRVRRVVAKGGAVGDYETDWGGRADLVATTDVTLVEWPGMTVRERIDAPALAVDRPVPGGKSQGSLEIVLGDQQVHVPLVMARSLDPPGFTWRLWRISLL
jgi:D-alanyl-D-alanine carboxypeptidase (penicillin-binding protein 5/6)